MIHNLHSGLHNCAHCVHFALNSVLEMSWASLNAESFPVSDAVTRKCFPPSARMCNKLKSSCWNLVRCLVQVCGASECGIRQHSWQIIHWRIIATAKHYSEAFIIIIISFNLQPCCLFSIGHQFIANSIHALHCF